MKIKETKLDLLLNVIIYAFLIFVVIITLYPFWNIFIISINDATDSTRGGLYLLPRIPTFDSYKTILSDPDIFEAIKVTVLRTLIGTPLALLCTGLAAYALSKRDLVGRKAITFIFIFTMYFGGGIIPYYMVLKSVNLIDSFWVFIVPNLFVVFNMILVRTFIEQLPAALEEAAKIDGANDLMIFAKIILPLCAPIMATVGLFIAVGHWNSWFDSYVFTYKPELKTLQAVLVKILNQYQTGSMVSQAQQAGDSAKRVAVSSESIRMATAMIATIPIVIVYPFLQKYFVKGMTIGAIKD
jgi:putative aldouronate transport system permease protein